jgi:uncharacterized protein DUF5915
MALEYTDRIRISLVTESSDLRAAAENFADYIKGETLATDLRLDPLTGATPLEIKIGEYSCQIFVAASANK